MSESYPKKLKTTKVKHIGKLSRRIKNGLNGNRNDVHPDPKESPLHITTYAQTSH